MPLKLRDEAGRRRRAAGDASRPFHIALLVLLALSLAACGGGEGDGGGGGGGTADPEAAWLALLAQRGLEPARDAVLVEVSGGAPTLRVKITASADAPSTMTFGDALFGAEAFTFSDGAWVRVDTADVRAEIAPLLEPGQSATVELPVRSAPSYRVLVPVAGRAAWGDG